MEAAVALLSDNPNLRTSERVQRQGRRRVANSELIAQRARAVGRQANECGLAPCAGLLDVGVAMGAHGSGASSEAADVVLLFDRLDRLAETLTIAHGARRIAMQTVGGGMALSGAAMAAAALGFLPPAAGALLLEVIDVAAILNSLRVLRVSIPGRSKITLPATEIAQLKSEHEDLSRLLDHLRALADRLAALSPAEAAVALTEADILARRLLRHEREDDTRLYPLIERMLGGSDPMASMHRAHREVQQLGGLFGRMVTDLPPGGAAEELNDFRQLLYALDAILHLHFAQEDAMYYGLADAEHARADKRMARA